MTSQTSIGRLSTYRKSTRQTAIRKGFEMHSSHAERDAKLGIEARRGCYPLSDGFIVAAPATEVEATIPRSAEFSRAKSDRTTSMRRT